MAQSPHILLIPMGTPGDAQPFIDLGIELQKRGRHVSLVANIFFQNWALKYDLNFIPLGAQADYQRMINDPGLWRLRKGMKVFAKRLVLPTIQPMYEIIARQAARGPTLIVAQTMALGARLAHEKLGVPMISVHRQPSVLRSVDDPGVFPWMFLPHWLPDPL
ncbi:MAG TPA: glycosyltransferase, partial [Tepidisphaeraceae bacterium]|nr:glycosyltransferase [Tepidisphaeraceae bacterium]